jgi:hypothetical protein
MKKIFIILGILLFLSGNSSAIDRSRYETSTHKYRSQFTDSEWQRHQLVHERFRSWGNYYGNDYDDDFDYRDYRYRHTRDNCQYNDSIRYDREYDNDWDEDCGHRGHNSYDEDK